MYAASFHVKLIPAALFSVNLHFQEFNVVLSMPFRETINNLCNVYTRAERGVKLTPGYMRSLTHLL